MKKQVAVLLEATKNKSEQTAIRVLSAVDSMEKNNIPINFNSVAKFANVSKTWLYNNKEIRQKIDQLRNKSKTSKRLIDVQLLLKKKDECIDKLTSQVNAQVVTIEKLKKQLETVYGELYKIKKD